MRNEDFTSLANEYSSGRLVRVYWSWYYHGVRSQYWKIRYRTRTYACVDRERTVKNRQIALSLFKGREFSRTAADNKRARSISNSLIWTCKMYVDQYPVHISSHKQRTADHKCRLLRVKHEFQQKMSYFLRTFSLNVSTVYVVFARIICWHCSMRLILAYLLHL